MLAAMKRIAAACLLLLATPLYAATAPLLLDASAWARPRSGQALLQMPVLRQAVAALGQDGRLVIHHPPGEDGVVWADQLAHWLVALGVPSGRIASVGDGGRDDALLLQIDHNPKGTP